VISPPQQLNPRPPSSSGSVSTRVIVASGTEPESWHVPIEHVRVTAEQHYVPPNCRPSCPFETASVILCVIS
jgi:hypothetical protein